MSNSDVLNSIAGQQFITVLTYERDWREIKTLAWFVIVGDSVCVWLRRDSGHVRRIGQYPRARITACDAQGIELSDDAGTSARLEPWIPLDSIEAAFRHKYGLLFWLAGIGDDIQLREYPNRRHQYIELEPQLVDRDKMYDEEMGPRRVVSRL